MASDAQNNGLASYITLDRDTATVHEGLMTTTGQALDWREIPGAKAPVLSVETDEAIAMFIRDTAGVWRLTGEAERLSISFPVTAGGTRTATFDVGGLDASKMPGW